MSKHLLIVGSGSVGKRHARNLAALGCAVSCMDPRQDRVSELAQETPCQGTFTDCGDALQSSRYDGVVICSPPSVHVAQAKAAIAHDLPILMEKPLTTDLPAARDLKAAAAAMSKPILLGYTWRWWPPIARVRELLDQQTIGALRHVHFQMSAHLADWHPWERYQDFFMSSAELGGGALLDESHWTDLAIWMFGMPRTVYAKIDKLSDLDIQSDDTVDMLWTYESGPRITIHLDIVGRPHEKYIRFIGDGGSLLWSAEPNQITWGNAPDRWEHVETFDCERNDMFVAVADEFLQAMSGERAPSCTIDDGVDVMAVVEAARRSNTSGSDVALAEITT